MKRAGGGGGGGRQLERGREERVDVSRCTITSHCIVCAIKVTSYKIVSAQVGEVLIKKQTADVCF